MNARNDEERKYLATHARRYELLLDEIARNPPSRLLDVGPSYEAELIRERFPSARIDTLGFYDERFPPREGETHTELDLTAADWPSIGPYDTIVCAEVIEHLHTSPVRALRMLRSFLAPDGWLIIQTPNAAALSRRFWLLAGRNPFEPLREDLHHAGHFREYTLAELEGLAERAGFAVERAERQNYFLTGSRKNRLLVEASFLTPAPLRQGITLALRPAKA